MGLKQQIVNNHTTDIAAKTKIIEAKAFVIYGHTSLTKVSPLHL
jgi:hypothetical protein